MSFYALLLLAIAALTLFELVLVTQLARELRALQKARELKREREQEKELL